MDEQKLLSRIKDSPKLFINLAPRAFLNRKKAGGEKRPGNEVWPFITSHAPIKSKLQHPSAPKKPRKYDYFLYQGGWGVGNFISKAFLGLAIDLCLGVVIKNEPEVSGFK